MAADSVLRERNVIDFMQRLDVALKGMFPFSKNHSFSMSGGMRHDNMGMHIATHNILSLQMHAEAAALDKWCKSLGINSIMDFVDPGRSNLETNILHQRLNTHESNMFHQWGFQSVNMEMSHNGTLTLKLDIIMGGEDENMIEQLEAIADVVQSVQFDKKFDEVVLGV